MKKIIDKLLPEVDETGTDGVWDLAGEIATLAALKYKELKNIKDDEPVWADECGQEEIYNLIVEYITERAR